MTQEEQEGFSLRPPTLEDVPAVVALLNTWWQEMAGTTFFSEEMTRSDWLGPGFDFTKDIRLASNGTDRHGTDRQELVGYISVNSKTPYVRNSFFGITDSDHRGRGIGTAMIRWAEARIADNMELAPATARVAAASSVMVSDESGAALLRESGYQHIRSGYEMGIELAGQPPQPVWPEGIVVRGLIPDQEEEAVYRALDESFRDHWGHVERPFDEQFASWLHHVRSNPHYDPSMFFVALEGDEIAGVALCFPKDIEFLDSAWLGWLGVRRPWRRRGLALAMLHHAFGESYKRGIMKVGLGVDATSLTGATRLYEKAGMRTFRQWDTYEKELRAGEDLTTQTLAE
jgi:GNAT superfamily N-acetyltransferase